MRKRAASAIAHANRASLTAAIVAQLSGDLRRRALMALARMRDEDVAEAAAAGLAQAWRGIATADRALVTLALGAVRLRQRWPMILYIGILGGFLAGLYCALARMCRPPISRSPSPIRATASARPPAARFFQGMAGGIVWGGCTSAWIALGLILLRRQGRNWLNNRYAVNLLFGILGGTFGGIGVFAEIFFVFEPSALAKLHWISRINTNSPATASPAATACSIQRSVRVTAQALGLGLPRCTRPRAGRNFWSRISELGKSCIGGHRAPHLRAQHHVHHRVGAAAVSSGLMFVVFKNFPLYTVLGETTSIYIGNIGTVAGILLGQLIMRVGFVVPPLTD